MNWSGVRLIRSLFAIGPKLFNLGLCIDCILHPFLEASSTQAIHHCFKCKVGDYTNLLWNCPVIRAYWSKVIVCMSHVFILELHLNPVSLILGLPVGQLRNKFNSRLFDILAFAARKNILLTWISDKPPPLNGWHKIIKEMIP